MVEIKEQEKQLGFPFRTVSDKFKLIDDRHTGHTVIIPWDDLCRKILNEADQSRFPGRYSRIRDTASKYMKMSFANFSEAALCRLLERNFTFYWRRSTNGTILKKSGWNHSPRACLYMNR